ncbi:MAG: hypothetical protein K1X55_04515 [Chitinophagales bacterium]|nr:hypothetical protein [Chitinophagales bacterium]
MKFLVLIITLFSLFSCEQKSLTEESLQHSSDTTNYLANEKIDNNIVLTSDSLNSIMTASRKGVIIGNWALEEGWFPSENLKFKKTNEEDYVFIFKKNGTIDYKTSSGFGDCPVGAFTLKDGNWSKDGQYLILELRGLKISDYWYWWKVQYRINELTEDSLILEVIKVIKSKEINPTLDWEDLLR